MHRSDSLLLSAIWMAMYVTVAAAPPAGAGEPLAGREAVALRARPFDLARVRLLEGPFRDNQERCRRYLHDLDSDRLLHMFRVSAGLPSAAEPLGGWERPDCEVRGHTMGHYLSACALMFASTGDAALKAKAGGIVAELARCQKALDRGGYLSAFPETWFDRVEACQPVWAPYYTLHKIYAGLIDMYVRCGNRQALEIAEGMAAWNKKRLDRLDEAAMQRMLDHTEQGGMNEALANLYAVTGKREYLEMARRFDQKRYVEPLARGEDRLKGEHVNSFIPNIIGTARQYELTGEERDRQIAEYFWNQVTAHRCYATGGTSNHEHWRTDPGKLASELGDFTQETCCTYNMLKLTGRLFSWEPRARLADYYERALYNSILSTQNPRTGMMMYFVVLAPGRWKMYNHPTEAFWCCTGTGLENHARYGEGIYSRDEEGLFVNLFIASELDWKERGIRLRQQTGFPEEEKTSLVLSVERPVELALRLRIPSWATRGFRARINGSAVDASAEPGSYLALKRTWRDGDRIDLDLPMSLRAEPMPDDETAVALMYGPLVLAGKLGGEGLTDETTHTTENWYRFENPAAAPAFVTESDKPSSWVRPVDGQPLTFQTVGQKENVTLVPLHRLYDQRYAVYWRVFTRGSPQHRRFLEEEAARRRRQARIVDECLIGIAHSERAHGLQEEKSRSGSHAGREWRDAADGWFSYDIAVLPGAPVTLACTYWGSDAGQRTFDVLVDSVKIATQTLDRNRPDEFFEVEYAIPRELTRGKEKVTVRFQARPGHIAGGVFGCAILKAEEN